MTHALIPGSFDPVTNGHINIIERSANLFTHVTIAIIANPNKKEFFSLEERKTLLEKTCQHLPNVSVDSFSGLLVNYARKNNIDTLIKGLRSVQDFIYELPMDHMNHHLADVETLYLATSPETSFISSSLVREIAQLKGDISSLVPPKVARAINKKLH